MIALSILSTILVMSSVIMIQIGGLYMKGINSANLQNSNRNVVADISQAIQYGAVKPLACTPKADQSTCYVGTLPAGPPSVNTVYAYCIDNTRYSYVIGHELGDDPGDSTVSPVIPPRLTHHVLWRDTMLSANNPCVPMDINSVVPTSPATSPSSGDGYEMVPSNTRLTRFYVNPNSTFGTYYIAVWMAYGDSDLMTTNIGSSPLVPSTCKGGAGTQYCAVSAIATDVTRRRTN